MSVRVYSMHIESINHDGHKVDRRTYNKYFTLKKLENKINEPAFRHLLNFYNPKYKNKRLKAKVTKRNGIPVVTIFYIGKLNSSEIKQMRQFIKGQMSDGLFEGGLHIYKKTTVFLKWK